MQSEQKPFILERQPSGWATALRVRWWLVGAAALTPLTFLFIEATEKNLLLVCMLLALIILVVVMIGMTGAQKYEAFLTEPYLMVTRSLRAIPTESGVRLEVDGKMIGDAPPEYLLSTATQIVTSMNGIQNIKTQLHLSLQVSGTIVRVKTFSEDQTEFSGALSDALREAFAIPRENTKLSVEPSLENSTAGMWGGAFLALAELGGAALLIYLAILHFQSPALPLVGAVLGWAGLHFVLHQLNLTWLREFLSEVAKELCALDQSEAMRAAMAAK